MHFPEPFSERLKRLRRQRGFSQKELEAQCAFSAGTLARIELGVRPALERHCLALAGALQLTRDQLSEGTDYGVAAVPLPSWLPPPPEWRRPEWTLERRYPSMLESYPRACREAAAEISKNPHSTQLAILFRDFWVDSNLEGIYWLKVAESALPHWLSPLACNFRAHAVVCPRTGLPMGDLRYPCLSTERALWFPQVTLSVNGYKHRPDCLLYRPGPGWSVIEIDGKGHRSERDLQRDKDLGLPTLRLDTADVFSKNLLAKLL